MKCPFYETGKKTPNKIGAGVFRECIQTECQAWEVETRYNPTTKQYNGDCRLCMLERKISGGINTHAY